MVATGLAVGGALLAPANAHAAIQPAFTADVTEVANERIDIAIDGAGFDEVEALPGQSEPHAYFTVVEKNSDLSEVGQADTAVSATVSTDGGVSEVLSVAATELVEGASYEVISWPSRSFPTEGNLYARTDITIDWAALFPDDDSTQEPGQPSFTADVTETANEGIDVAIEGAGYDLVEALPGQTEPHAYFTLIEKDSDLSGVGQSDTAISASIEADGTLSDVLTVPASELVEGVSYEVISWPSRSNPTEDNLYARTDITIDWAALFPGDEEPGEEEPGEEEPGEEEPGAVSLTILDANGEAVTSVTQGDAIDITVSPVEVGAAFTVTVTSDPVTLPSAVADADGVASTTWTVPEDFTPGEHTVTFASENGAASYSAAFEVLPAGDRPSDDGGSDAGPDGAASGAGSGSGSGATAGGTTGGGNGDLAATGAESPFVLVGVAGVLTLLGAAILVVARRASAQGAR
ncbi:MAG: hypothetical protein ACTH31_05315 [Pseudoclavibacter sp.]